MKRRKHRVVVEITMEEKTSTKGAKMTVQRMLDDWMHRMQHVVTKVETKEYDRVARAELLAEARSIMGDGQ